MDYEYNDAGLPFLREAITSTLACIAGTGRHAKSLDRPTESSRETWQTIGRYEPERHHEHPDQRRAAAVQVLRRVPHEAHAEWTPPNNRPNPVDIVVAGNAGRQEQFVPLRMGRMAASPFAFLRGPPR